MYQPILRPAQQRQADESSAALSRAMIDLTLYGANVIAPVAALLSEQPALLAEGEARILLVRLLKTAMGPLEREGDWAPMAVLLQTLDAKSATALQEALLPQHDAQGNVDPTVLPDATVVVLAGLMDAEGRPGKALAMLDDLEPSRNEPRFMRMSWQARCHILHTCPTIDALWSGVSIGGNNPRALARQHAEGRCMEEALLDMGTALDQAMTTSAWRGIGADLAVLAAWLHGHGQGALLESYRPIGRHMADHPLIAREALDLLLRAPASRPWDAMRENWLEAARRYFQRFATSGQASAARPDDVLMHCRPAA